MGRAHKTSNPYLPGRSPLSMCAPPSVCERRRPGSGRAQPHLRHPAGQLAPRHWRSLAPCHSPHLAAIVLEHERRLDHVRKRRHLLVAEHLLEHREHTLRCRRVGRERADDLHGARPRRELLAVVRPPWPSRFSKISQKFACVKTDLPVKNLPVFKKKSTPTPIEGPPTRVSSRTQRRDPRNGARAYTKLITRAARRPSPLGPL